MNQQQRAVVQQVIDVLKKDVRFYKTEKLAAITALRQLLEQPEPVQEPVGEVSGHDWSTGLLYRDLEPGTLLYTTSPAQPADQPDYEFHYRQLLEKYEALQSASKPAAWFGLNAGDLAEIPPSAYMGAIWADAKLREKNGGAA